MNRIKIGQLNINSIRNKFDLLVPAVVKNLDILLITETKIDNSFPEAQFEIDGFTTRYRVDRDCHGGGILLYIRQDIPSKLLINLNISENLEEGFVELNFRRKKWLVCCSYNPQKSNVTKHLDVIGKNFDLYSSRCQNYLLLGDFNSEPSENAMIEFCKLYKLKNLVKGATCYKNPETPSCIDLILTNRPKSFHGCHIIETGLPVFHKMAVNVMKMYFKKQGPRVIHYSDYKRFSTQSFRQDVFANLHEENVNRNQLEKFLNVFKKVFGIHALIKKRYIRANQGPFMNKALQKAVMTRSRPRNNFLQNKAQSNASAYKKQINYCVSSFRKEKKSFFENLCTKNITDNKKFWKTAKPFLANKISSNRNKITLTRKDEIISRSKDVAEIFNTFFVNAISNLGIVINESLLGNSVDTNDPIVNIIERYKTHPSIRLIKEHATQLDNRFSFEQITYKDIHKEIRKLDCTKASQDTDIPSSIIK